MTIEWLAGNRLRGTTAERPNLGLPSGSVGGWVEVGRTTLGAAGSTIDVTSLPDKRYYMVLSDIFATGGSIDFTLRFNGDSGSNYAYRKSEDGAADGTSTSKVFMLPGDSNNANGMFSVGYTSNLSSKEKLFISNTVHGLSPGAGTAPKRVELVGKHVQTSNPISSMTMTDFGTSSYDTNSEVVVLGWDPADTHTSNFWQEIGSATGTGIEDITLSSTKKYIWFQAFIKSGGASGNFQLRAGNGSLDTGSNYSERRSTNGGADATGTSQTSIGTVTALYDSGEIGFLNGLIINNASNEKLFICHITDNTPGSGAGTAPNRREIVGKWANTSNAIDHLGYLATSGSVHADSVMKVWGSD